MKKESTPEGMLRDDLIIELYKQIDKATALQARVQELEGSKMKCTLRCLKQTKIIFYKGLGYLSWKVKMER